MQEVKNTPIICSVQASNETAFTKLLLALSLATTMGLETVDITINNKLITIDLFDFIQYINGECDRNDLYRRWCA